MLFLHFLYSKTFKCIFVDLCSKVLTLCTLRLSSFFAFEYLRIYFQTPCWTRLMLHVRKYRMKHNLKDECYAPCEHWHCIENPNPIANGLSRGRYFQTTPRSLFHFQIEATYFAKSCTFLLMIWHVQNVVTENYFLHIYEL